MTRALRPPAALALLAVIVAGCSSAPAGTGSSGDSTAHETAVWGVHEFPVPDASGRAATGRSSVSIAAHGGTANGLSYSSPSQYSTAGPGLANMMSSSSWSLARTLPVSRYSITSPGIIDESMSTRIVESVRLLT